MGRRLPALLLLCCLCLACCLPTVAKSVVSLGLPLPAFSLPDTDGHLHGLAELRGKPVALFFFCGCRPCHDCARLWAQVQANGDLGGKQQSSVVVFSGPAADARKFAADTGLDPAQTLVLADPDDRVTSAYGVRQCPRIFVAGPLETLAYTSPDTGDPAPRLPAPALVSRVLTVWHTLGAAPILGAAALHTPLADTPHLEFAALPGSTSPQPGILHLDAGRVDVDRTPHWAQTFTLKNPTRQPLTISDLRGSCGCESLLLTRAGVAAPRLLRLAPGETAEVKLDVTLAANLSGSVRKYVWVYGPGPKPNVTETLATLELDMTLVQSVRFAPESLRFGRVASGAGAMHPLTVTADADLLAGRPLPPLTCDNPAVRAVPSGTPQRTMQEGRAAVSQAYTVQLLSSAPAGAVEGDLRFAPPAGVSPDTSPLSRPSASVSGTIAGALDALPASVFFGSLPAGKPAARTVVLSLAVPANVQSLTVRTSAPWLHAALDLSSAAPAKHHLLTVTLTAQAPLGPLQATITVAAGQNNQVAIPVIAELTK